MNEKTKNWLERPLIESIPAVTGEVFVFGLIIILAIISRFYDLDILLYLLHRVHAR